MIKESNAISKMVVVTFPACLKIAWNMILITCIRDDTGIIPNFLNCTVVAFNSLIITALTYLTAH